jgi:hypothetical protein
MSNKYAAIVKMKANFGLVNIEANVEKEVKEYLSHV